MADERNPERQFVHELLNATRGGRVNWTGTVLPGRHQFIAGDYLVAIGDEAGAPVLALHHVSGHRLEILHPVQFGAEGGEPDLAPVFEELLELARSQALGLRRRWRWLSKQVAAATVPPN